MTNVFRQNGKRPMWCQFTKKMINKSWKIIGWYHYKIFERIIYNTVFKYLIESSLITENQSGFKPGDSGINQLLSITHDIYKSFDDGFEVKDMFDCMFYMFLASLAKWLSVRLRLKWLWIRVPLQSLKKCVSWYFQSVL